MKLYESLFVNRRVCPLPIYWNDFWQSLPSLKRVGSTWSPSPPLILAAWHLASDGEKRARFEEHLEWADQHGSLNEALNFLNTLGEADWHHEGD